MIKIIITIFCLTTVSACVTNNYILKNGKKADLSQIKKSLSDTISKEYIKRFNIFTWKIFSIKVAENTLIINTKHRKPDFAGLDITLDSNLNIIQILETYKYW